MPIAQPTPANIAEAARLIRCGQLVALPTETVYGLGADATQGVAVARIFEAKGRPRFNPLIATVADLAAAEEIAHLNALARVLAAAFWPGPLTLVLPRRDNSGIAELATAGLDTIAVRVPSHPVAQALLRAAGCPIAAPSANRSGHVSATTAEHVAADLADSVAMILDAGPTAHGLKSTIVSVLDGDVRLLRPGAVTAEAIAAVLAPHTLLRGGSTEQATRPSAPGQLESHYATNASLRLNATAAEPGEALLAFGPVHGATDAASRNLSATGDLVEAAANLFAFLRQLDASGASRIAVMAVPEHGLGAAINDRLRRAAAPRPQPNANAGRPDEP